MVIFAVKYTVYEYFKVMSLCHCCCTPTFIKSVLSYVGLSLLVFINNEMSVTQSLTLDRYVGLCVFNYDSAVCTCVASPYK